MATTTKAPPKSFRGRSARELMSAEAADGGPPVTVFGTSTRMLTLHAGTELVVDGSECVDFAQLPEAETDIVTVHAAGFRKIQFQCPIIESSVSEGTRIRLVALTFLNGTFVPLTAATDGPWIPVHEALINSDGTPLPISSGWFVMDEAFNRDNLTITWQVGGSDGTGEFIPGDIFVELSSDPRPPTTEVPNPEPPAGDLWAEWNPAHVDGTSQWLTNQAPNGEDRRLITGDSDADGSRDPTLLGPPPVAATLGFGGGGVDHHYLRNNSPPSLAAGSSIFFYGKVTSLGTAAKFLCGITNGSIDDHFLWIDPTSRLVTATITENAGGPTGTARSVTGTTPILNSSEHTFCIDHDGATLSLYIDGVLEGSTGCSAAKEPGGRVLTFCCGSPPLTILGGPDNYSHGLTRLYTRGQTAAEVAENHANAKLTYPGLP